MDKLLKSLGCLALIVIALVAAAYTWVANNEDKVEAFAANVYSPRKQHCEALRREAQDHWNRSVDSGSIDRDSEALARLEQEVEAECGSN